MINKPEEYILDEWEEMYEIARLNLKGGCPLLQDEVITYIHHYIKQLENELASYQNDKNWTRPFDNEGNLITEHALYIPRILKDWGE